MVSMRQKLYGHRAKELEQRVYTTTGHWYEEEDERYTDSIEIMLPIGDLMFRTELHYGQINNITIMQATDEGNRQHLVSVELEKETNAIRIVNCITERDCEGVGTTTEEYLWPIDGERLGVIYGAIIPSLHNCLVPASEEKYR